MTLTSRPVKHLPDIACKFVVRKDASDRGLSAALMQGSQGKIVTVGLAFCSFVEQVLMATCLLVTTYGIVSSRKMSVLSSLPLSAAKPKSDSEEWTKETHTTGDGLKPGAYNGESKIQNRQIVPVIDERQKKRLKKEIRAIKQSVIVVLIHMICVTPRIVLYILNLAMPHFTLQAKNKNLFDATYLGLNVNDCINALENNCNFSN
ncbi:hypothetical protein PoB_005178700 [Plakobranchus ocellatus]|uniref:G-protein coupled receptors family 1 profile domain-containing protein n=1 Tax=Plakobranchus ocellatus TaxID=259542 RepID=A0AAV4C1Q7_9GAST|nr:hypothetical protein PoB_005178700 [Plakobranchus ocellatus]